MSESDSETIDIFSSISSDESFHQSDIDFINDDTETEYETESETAFESETEKNICMNKNK